MEYSYKFRIYPNKEQEHQIQRAFGCYRFVYNYYLALRKEVYKTSGETLSYYDCCKYITKLKQENEWLREADSTAIQASIKDLDTAYQNFFRRLKSGEKPGYPQFKTKRSNRKSYKSKNVGNTIRVDDSHVRLPKIGFVKCSVSKKVEGRILSATVLQNPSGKYFVAICCTDIDIKPLPSSGSVVGIDLGIKDLVITSDGAKYPNAKYLNKSEKKLARLQRQLSRKTSGSNRKEKARIKVARLHEHVANQRLDAIHKITTDLIQNYDLICIESLNTKGMIKNHTLARALNNVVFGEIRRQLNYKATWYGKKIEAIDRFYPSSQICSCCGAQWHGVKDLSVREWICPVCGAAHDRDINAATNILNEGIRQIVA